MILERQTNYFELVPTFGPTQATKVYQQVPKESHDGHTQWHMKIRTPIPELCDIFQYLFILPCQTKSLNFMTLL